MNKIIKVTQGPWAGLVGEVIRENKRLFYVRKPDGNGCAMVGKSCAVEVVKAEVHIPDEHPADFSHSGLGIGGINNDQSMPVIPSVQAIERVQRMHDTDIICRRCGASKNFDGAMFTTGGGDICDDCF